MLAVTSVFTAQDVAAQNDDALVADAWTATVGMPTKIEQVVIAGGELVVRDLEPDSPFVLRIIATYPHGTNHRYDLEYYGLEPGTYDLWDYLRRVDNSSLNDMEPLPVSITPILPPGQIEPSAVQAQQPNYVGGYRMWLIIGGIVWFVGLIGLILLGRQKKRAAAEKEVIQVSLADRLRPLVEDARNGELSAPARAELERLLLTFWRRKLGLADEDPAIALRKLREHPEAGVLLKKLESWLYEREQSEQVDLNELLEPYRHIAADDVVSEMRASTQEPAGTT